MRNNRKGFSLIELLVVVAIILIIAAIAMPNLLRSIMAANEASAVQSLRTMISTSTLYDSTYGTYPQMLTYLGPSGNQLPWVEAADLIDARLATGVKSGYNFTWTPGPTDPSGHIVSFSVVAQPTYLNVTGQRTFYTDSTGVIRSESSGIATSSSSPIN